MTDITNRQKQLLAAIIEQYAEVAAPVGSVTLAKLFDVSSATIRSEMAKLEELGYIQQPHTSAGRIPTDKGYRFFVNQLIDLQKEPGTRNQEPGVSRVIGRRVNHAGEPAQMIRSAADSLAEITDNLGLATIGRNLYMSGLTRLFNQPEFSGGSVYEVADLIDNLEPWLREAAPNKPINVFIGRENPIGRSSGCTLVISRYRSPFSDRSYIGVLGPTRQSYRDVMNIVSYAGELLEEKL